jgi:putative lipoic acid-binding regulatory protein
MPGITQASIKTETRGSLKTATINIIAHNKEQFDIIDVLYMSLGYSILLEWGNSSYFK